jgi:hypothetical protein
LPSTCQLLLVVSGLLLLLLCPSLPSRLLCCEVRQLGVLSAAPLLLLPDLQLLLLLLLSALVDRQLPVLSSSLDLLLSSQLDLQLLLLVVLL